MRKWVLLAVCVAAYVAWPYASMVRIAMALQRGDAEALAAEIDWAWVREGLKEDIADGLTGQPVGETDVASDALPPFGAGFIKAMAASMVDQTVTPENLCASLGALQAVGADRRAPEVKRAWFTGPTSFEAQVLLPAAEGGAAPLRVRMDLVHEGWLMGWRVTRAWVPAEVLERLETQPG